METTTKETKPAANERALAFAKQMMASKREIQQEMEEAHSTPEYQKSLKELRARNEKRGTAIVRL